MIPLGVLGSAHVPAAGGGGDLTYIGTTAVTLSSTTQTVSGVSIGAASASRTVLVIASLDNGREAGTRSISGLTSSGGTLTADASVSGAAPTPFRIARAAMPTGSTADFTVTASAIGVNFALSVYTFDAAVSLTDSDVDTAPTSTDSLTLDTTAGGFILAGIGARNSMNGSPVTSFSSDFENQAVRHGVQSTSGASTNVTVAGLNLLSSSGRFIAAAYA